MPRYRHRHAARGVSSLTGAPAGESDDELVAAQPRREARIAPGT